MVKNAINSVLQQTYENWELIIVDDGSTDNTNLIVDKLKKKDKRIKYLYQTNKERSSARNYGIQNSKGDFICFLDSDDLYHKTHLEEFNNLIVKNKFQIGIYFSGLSYDKFSPKEEKYNLFYSNNIEFVLINIIGTPRACISKKILRENLFNEQITISEDKELWVRILKKHPFFFHKNKTFIQKEHKKRSINLISKKADLRTLKIIIKDNYKLINKNIKNQAFSNAYFNISKNYIFEKKNLKAIYYTLLSLLVNIKNRQTRHKILLLLSLMGLYNKKVKSEYQDIK